MKSIDTWTT